MSDFIQIALSGHGANDWGQLRGLKSLYASGHLIGPAWTRVPPACEEKMSPQTDVLLHRLLICSGKPFDSCLRWYLVELMRLARMNNIVYVQAM